MPNIVYYHGTLPENVPAILKHGICPPKVCPVKESQRYHGCDPNAIFVSTDIYIATTFGESSESEPVIFEITKLPKNCQILPDPAGYDSFRIKGCKCIRPQRYCKPTTGEIRKMDKMLEGDWPPKDMSKLCGNWKRVR